MSAPAHGSARARPRPPPRPAGGGPFGRGPMGGMGMPAEKAMTFGPSARRLLRRLAPERREGRRRPRCSPCVSVGFAVAGPKLLGRATDIIFAGVLGRQLPAGITTQQAADAARAAGHGNIADLLLGMDVVPGQGIDFGALATCCCWALALYVAASVFSWLQGYLLNDVVAAHRVPAALRRRGQAAPAAAAVLRPPAARRAAQPGHQRHRQHVADPAADDEPAAHLAAHRDRRAGR